MSQDRAHDRLREMTNDILASNGITWEQYQMCCEDPIGKRFFRRILIIDYWVNTGVVGADEALALRMRETYANYERECREH